MRIGAYPSLVDHGATLRNLAEKKEAEEKIRKEGGHKDARGQSGKARSNADSSDETLRVSMTTGLKTGNISDDWRGV